jgi:hypothetical protein
MAQHPLDGEMGLAGVGWTKDGGHAGATQAAVAGHRRRERNRHPFSRLGVARFSARHAFMYHNATPDSAHLTFGNESGTNPARIGDSAL